MKQHITPEDWGTFERSNPEAAKKAREYYSNWQEEYIRERYPNQFVTMDWWPINIFFNIGQMIEFLQQYSNMEIRWNRVESLWYFKRFNKSEENNYIELCDALWEAVKNVLNK